MTLHKDIKYCLPSLIGLFLFPLFHVTGQEKQDTAISTINPNDTSQSKAVNDTLTNDTVATKDTMISSSAIEAQVQYDAEDSVIFDLKNNKAYLYNKAHIVYQDMDLKSGKISLDWEKNLIEAHGIKDTAGNLKQKPVFKQGNKTFETDSMRYNFNSKKGKLYGLKTQEGEGYMHGTEVKKDERDVIYASKAKYTTCDKDDPHFHIAANKIKTIPNDKIISGPANLVVEDVPLPLVLPFGFFPNTSKQSSGLILPGYGEAQDRGFFLRGGGYYFGISDQVDMAIRGDIYSKGGWSINPQVRYKKRYKFDGNLNLRYGVTKLGEPEDPNYQETTDYAIRWSHNQAQAARPYSHFSASVDIASEDVHRNNWESANRAGRNNLNSSISYTTNFPGSPFRLTSNINHEQRLEQGDFNIEAPQTALNMNRIFPFKNAGSNFISNVGVNYDLNFKNNVNGKDSNFLNPNNWGPWNNGFRQNASLSTSARVLNYFSLNPGINYTSRIYFDRTVREFSEEKGQVISKKEKGLYNVQDYNFNTNLSTRIYGMFNIDNWGIKAMRHVLTPSLNVSYAPDFSSPQYNYYSTYQDTTGKIRQYSYFRNNVFGTAGSGERGALGINLNNNLEMKVADNNDTSKSTKKISLIDQLTINTNYNFLAESHKLSNIRINANTSALNFINFNANATVDPYYLRTSDTTRTEKLSISKNGSIGRITAFGFTANTRLSPETFNSEESSTPPRPMMGFGRYRSSISRYYTDFEIPWNLDLTYNVKYSKPQLEGRISDHTTRASGSIKLTDKWRVQLSANYDLKTQQFSPSDIRIKRDLHCWEMNFTVQPFGTRQYYMFTINAKANVLRDLELEKRDQSY